MWGLQEVYDCRKESKKEGMQLEQLYLQALT